MFVCMCKTFCQTFRKLLCFVVKTWPLTLNCVYAKASYLVVLERLQNTTQEHTVHERRRSRFGEVNHMWLTWKSKLGSLFFPGSQILTDVVYGPSTEFAIELFGPKTPQVMDGEGPEVQHVVSGEGVSLFYHHHFGTHQSKLNGCPQTTGASSNNEALNKREWYIRLSISTRHRDVSYIMVTSL